MFNWENEDFSKESPYSDELDALVTAIRESIRKEVQEEMNRLQEENKKIQGIKEHFEEVKRDYERKKAECDRVIANAEYKARTARLSNLMEDHKLVRWGIEVEDAYGKKCDKCNGYRRINVTLPSGDVVADRCKCLTERREFYLPAPYGLYQISGRNGIVCHYKECETSDGEKYYNAISAYTMCDCENKELLEKLISNKIEKYEIRKVLFDTKEECQKICDELNAKEGHPDWVYRLNGERIAEENVNQKSG